ncbi:MAG: rhomboid family intramembrane serine protease [Planctomycetaceae bacterium]|nr:rhomboid family intramembrane serine protease [Planctomycetaceae bacterium]
MGIHDRDYYRPQLREREYYRIQPGQSWVFAIIIVNIMVFFANAIRGDDVINHLLLVKSTTLANPLEWWRLVTYAFAHGGLGHLFFNMLTLFIFGPLVERKYGPVEFMCFYFVTAVLGGIFWGLLHINTLDTMLGASGAISGVIMIVICSYPRMPIYLWGILEMPLWLFGTIFIAMNTFGFFDKSNNDRVAYDVHLAGVGFGVLYWWLKWRISDIPRLLTRSYWQERQRRRRFFNPKDYSDRYNRGVDNEDDDAAQRQLEADEGRSEQVDAILRKISEKGQDSLTWSERRILKRASRDYQKKNKPK